MGKKEEIKLKVLDSDKGKENSEELSNYGSQGIELEQGESEERRSQGLELEVDPGCSSRISGYIDDPFPTIGDKTIQRTGDIYLSIPGAMLSLGASIAFAAKAPPLMSGIFTLFGATATMGGKVVSGVSDRRMLKKPMIAAQDAKVNEEDLLPKGCVESSAYYANLVNLGATIISVAGIIVGGLFLFGVIFNNDTNNDTHSSGGDASTFSNKEILGILLNAVAFLDNFLKVLKGYEVKYRERITKLTKEHEKQVKEEKTWLPEIKQRREEIRLLVENLKLIINEKDGEEGYNEENKLLLNCESFLNDMADKKFNLQFRFGVSRELDLNQKFLEALRDVESKLNDIGLELCDSSLEGESLNKVMQLLEKIGKRSNLYKLERIEEWLKFLTSEMEKQEGLDEEKEKKEDIKDRLAQLKDDLSFIRGQLKEIIKTTLDQVQRQSIRYGLEDLRSKIDELEEESRGLRSSVSNISSFRIR